MFLKTAKAKNFYFIAGLFTATGWLWFLWTLYTGAGNSPGICFFRNITGHPCPACGSTRSLQMIAGGDLAEAFFVNPLGYLVGLGMLLLPSWIVFDLITKRYSAYSAFIAFDRKMKDRPVILILILIPLILNWIWSLIKM